MKNEIDALHGSLDRGAICHAGFDECMGKTFEVAAVPGSQIVEDDDFSEALEMHDHMASDEARAAIDEYALSCEV